MVSAETLLPKRTIFVSISVNLLANVDILDELRETCSTVLLSIRTIPPLVKDDGKLIMFAFGRPVVISSNLSFLSSVMILLKVSILFLDDYRLLSQYYVLTTSFSSMGGCIFVLLKVCFMSIFSLSSRNN